MFRCLVVENIGSKVFACFKKLMVHYEKNLSVTLFKGPKGTIKN
jgi:hypothetical protein